MLVEAEPAHLDLGIGLAESAETVREWPGLGRREAPPFRLVLVRDREGFSRLARGRLPAWGAGMTVPAARLIVIRLDGGDPRATFRHELAHLVLHDALPGRVPLWFSEGYAVVAAEEWNRLLGLQLNLAVARGRIPELRALDGALREGDLTAQAAYALAGSAVLLLARLHPDRTLDALLGKLMDRQPFPEAVLAATGYPLESFGEVWRKDVRRRYGLFVWLAAGGMWLVIAAAVVFLRGWRRGADAARKAALDRGWVIPPEALEEPQVPATVDDGPPPE